MTKTFKSSEGIGSLEVDSDGPYRLYLSVKDSRGFYHSTPLGTDAAPALALAILEAAGAHKDSQDFLGGAVEQLRFHIGEQERVTAEARERAELEAEALELHNAFWAGLEEKQLDSWDDERGNAKNSWVSAARRAREMRAEK